MKEINKGRLAFTSLLLMFALVVVIASLFYEPRARLIPLTVGIGILILGLPLLVHEVHPIRLLSILDLSLMDIGKDGKENQQKESDQQVSKKKVLEIIAWMCGFFIIIFLLGFHIGIIVYAFTFLKTQAEASLPKTCIATAIIWCLTYFLFEVALGFTMFKGLFFGELMPRL